MLTDCIIPCAEHFLQLMLNKMRSVRCLGRLALLVFIALQCDCRDTEFNYVTCGSLVKLLNTRHNVRLHSHDVKYGSGSGQQSVTGVESSDDANSYWRIRGKPNAPCERGAPIKCGQAIRITHMNTGRNLHTHHFVSPLSSNQEVSAFGENGEGDDLDVWTVQCSGTYWERDEAVRFKHKGTEVFLSVTGEQYNHPIRGQREVHGMPHANHHNYWKTMEGVFIKTSAELGHHDEL
ncbi:stromal cell-derived factor 2-like protein 1 [Paramormyrops kingsleyae]|uniref:Stromal cell-derived factor 2-like 1 n=1 Tax=Paramormyrops kingsleyae TaxID=1676925 RepID=A0A3B3TFF2_9TELE|nr:stromal cell-derived factor 2-like [Paramormyrops kingsleyae]